MMAKEKDQTLSKLKNFFKTNRGGVLRERQDTLDPVLEATLRPETPVAQRCKELKEFGEVVLVQPLQENLVPKLWDLTKDLIAAHKPQEQRQVALEFYCKLIQGQYKDLGPMRAHFFNVIQNHDVKEDLKHRLDLLRALTNNGKDIGHFEERIGPFMLQWIAQIAEAGLLVPFLEVLIHIIRFNTAYLDRDIIMGILYHACHMSCSNDNHDTVLQCLSVLDTVIRYAIFPNESLSSVIFALCRTVNVETYCQQSWQIMRNLLGTDLGHAALLMMCQILTEPGLQNDACLLRGAVFHINMGVWGSSSSAAMTLRCTPTMTLNSFLKSLGSGHVIVTYEVVLSVQRLIQNQGQELTEPTWDVILDILSAVADNNRKLGLVSDNVVQRHFHETLDTIEIMVLDPKISVDVNRVYDLIEKVCEERSVPSVERLIEYRSSRIKPSKGNWLHELYNFIDRFYKKMSNTMIRVHAIEALTQIMHDNRAAYEEEILDQIIMPHFGNLLHEKDRAVRIAAANLMINLSLHCETKRCLELFDIIEKAIMRQYTDYPGEGYVYQSEEEIHDIKVLVEGLIQVFLTKLHRLPSTHAIFIYNMLIMFMEHHYQRPKAYENTVSIRYHIFDWMLKARANASYHLGYPESTGGPIKYSHYLGIEHSTLTTQLSNQSTSQSNQNESSTVPPVSFTTIPIRRGCKLIVKCLEVEKNWTILRLVLEQLPAILQNKALIQGNDIDYLTKTLHKMYTDKKFIETISVYGKTPRPQFSDFQAALLPVIAAAATYHQYLDVATQKKIVEVLKLGLFSKAVRVCVHALTLLLLEITDVIIRLLPDVLYEMSKMSSTVQHAGPILEFLSTLNRLPNHRFANFIQRECMYVFAISLPYTNPYRYDHYTVSLAHHVVAGWFLKCRLSWRSDLVGYIIAGLESNIHLPLQEQRLHDDYSAENEDSSNRKRSSSLTEHGSRRRTHSSGHPMYAFHMELAETCIDFMARHTFSVCSALPKRMPAADFLLTGGQHTTWLVGHSLITITTSGCSLTPVKNGLCDKCHSILPNHQLSKSESTASSALPTSPDSNASRNEPDYGGRRYTKASLQLSGTNESDSTDITSSSSSAAPTPYPNQLNQEPVKFFRQNSQEGRFSSSSSLEALSRRGSNPDQNSEGYESQTLSHTSRPDTRRSTVHPLLAAPMPNTDRPRQVCACCCTGWAEICIRRPTGTMSWVMRIQNQITYDSFTNEFPLQDLTTLLTPNYGGIINPNLLKTEVNRSNAEISKILSRVEDQPGAQSLNVSTTATNTSTSEVKQPKVSISDEVHEIRRSIMRVNEVDLDDEAVFEKPDNVPTVTGPIDIPGNAQKRKESDDPDFENDFDETNPDVVFDDYSDARSRNPVRRVNSSPEMSSNYRNPYLAHKAPKEPNSTTASGTQSSATSNSDDSDSEGQQKKKTYTKDMRVSCEAIPEEMGGSTPPSLTGSVSKDDTITANAEQKKETVILATAVTTPEPQQLPQSQPQQQPQQPKKQGSADEVLLTGKTTVAEQTSGGSSQPALNLKIPTKEIQKVTTKPPQSPAPLSPRLIAKNAANKFASNSGTASPSFPSLVHNHNEDLPRGRSKTISVTSREHYTRDNKWSSSRILPRSRDQQPSVPKSGISPSFVFLQLYHSGQLNIAERPLMLDNSSEKSVNLLDLIPPFETFCIGVLYVGQGQTNNETEILRNRYGSYRYSQFLCNLGTLVNIKEAKENNLFLNMESDGRDGIYTYLWQDDIIHVLFHVATLMPNKEQDPNCNEKKKHIGNDFVQIVFNESGEDYSLNTIKGQFNYACVIVEPLELNSNRVYVRAKDELREFISNSEPKIVSDNCVALVARQLALHANIASKVFQSLKTKNHSPYASNWLERLRKIKGIRTKLNNKGKKPESHQTANMDPTVSSTTSASVATHDIGAPTRFSTINDFILYTKPKE